MIAIILEILSKLIKGISPKIREEILNFLKDLEAKAQETPNPVDDIIVLLLRILFGFQNDRSKYYIFIYNFRRPTTTNLFYKKKIVVVVELTFFVKK